VTLSKLAVLMTAVALAATGQLVLKHGMVQAQSTSRESGRTLLLVAASSPWIIGGLMIFAASAVGWLLTLAHVPLSVAYPFNALGYIAILLASTLVLHERTNIWMWLGTVLVGAGLLLVVLMAPAASAASPATPPAKLASPVMAPRVGEPVKADGDDGAKTAPEPGSTWLGPHRAR
jgi:drug/metabolite transporter (DMT)-like permease